MNVVIERYCDKCGNHIASRTGAEVLKYTTDKAHPIRHLCERCYAEVFEKVITKENRKEVANG